MTATKPTAVPLCDLKAQYRDIGPQIEAAVIKVLASGQAILGPEVKAFEEETAAYLGITHSIGCASGTDALMLALQALDISAGDEVILPPFTFFATAGVVCRLGARPVFADVDPQTLNLDALQVENKITSRTRAIITVHLYGQCAEMEPLWQIAERHDIPVIEDAAQAWGADYRGKRAGTLGSIGCFSFYPSKNLGAFGDAGLVVTDNPSWAERMRWLRVHGMEPKYYHKCIGWNARLDALQAAILRVKMPYIDAWTAQRQNIARVYNSLIETYHLSQFLERPCVRPDRRHVFHQYVVRVADGLRDFLFRHLQANNVGCEIYYPVPLHLQECMAFLGYQKGDFPASEDAAQTVLALPMFPELTPAQQERVIDCCAEFLRKRARLAA